MREFFDGAVKHSPPVVGGTFWLDEWWGPGGHLVVTPGIYDGHRETLTTSDDGVHTHVEIREGANYELLPELMGEHWETYLAMTHK